MKIITLDGSKQECIVINQNELAIGRDSKLKLARYLKRKTFVSRNHCVLVANDDSLYIMDMGSLNGTFVNGKRLESNKKVQIFKSDLITLGAENDNENAATLIVKNSNEIIMK